jgi:dsRNA-specific ribonuclease
LFWDAENTFKVTLGDPVRSASLTPDLLEHLRASTQLLHRSTHSDHNTHNSSDFVALFGPDVADHQLSNWVIANQGRRGVLDVPGAGRTKLDGFIRSPLLHGSPHIFCGWRRNFGAENEGDLDIDCIPLLKRRNFEVPNTLAARSTILDDDPNDASHTLQFHARDCTVDHLDMKYAVFSLFIPSILRHIEAYCVADQLQKTILQQVQFQDAGNIVTAITAPSASWTTNYQRYEFIGDAVLKFQTSVQLYSDHGNWPEGYLSQRRDSLVSNANLARAALSIKLDQYILTDAPRRKGWSPPRISDVKLCEEERKLGRKILADVIEALIGAAFIDGGLGAARSCINIFIPEIRVGKPEISIFLPNHKNSTGEPETELLIGYQFRNQALLLEALTHPTCDTDTNTESYQRLEFLGDAVLDVLICRSLSQCQPELTQGQMTRIKGALANSGLLGFLCLSFSKDRIDVRIEESGDCKFTEVRSVEKVPLWKFMRHHSVDVVQAQVDCSERYRKYGAEIQSCLSKGECYPWVLLARLNPEKFYSDMIESIIGAIFVDSQGDLSECQQFFDRIGLGLFASRMASGRLDVVHPRDKLQRVAGSSKVDIHVESVGSDTACFRCTIKIDGSVHAEVDGCMTKEEACVSGADAAVALLSSMQEHARRAVLRSSCGQSPYPTRSA